MKLNFKEIGEGKPLLILHGLFGSSDNWVSIARVLSKSHKVFLIDQRNHGDSPHSTEFNYDVMAADLKEFVEDHSITNFDLIGHSLGGKTAMVFSNQHPELVDKLIIVDIAPKRYPVHHDSIIEGLKSIDLHKLQSRTEADNTLSKFVPLIGVRQFLLKNLKRNSNGFEWKINLDAICKEIEEVGKELSATARFANPTLFIRGELSDYILENDMELIIAHFPNAKLATVKGASHWIHAEKPDAFLKEANNFLSL